MLLRLCFLFPLLSLFIFVLFHSLLILLFLLFLLFCLWSFIWFTFFSIFDFLWNSCFDVLLLAYEIIVLGISKLAHRHLLKARKERIWQISLWSIEICVILLLSHLLNLLWWHLHRHLLWLLLLHQHLWLILLLWNHLLLNHMLLLWLLLGKICEATIEALSTLLIFSQSSILLLWLLLNK